MISRRISLTITKYIAILLCLIAILLTTPLGARLTLALLNNIDVIDVDYKSGSLVRDIQLNSFHLKLDNLDLAIKGLSAEIDFSCSLKKTLCIKSLKADDFFLRYKNISKTDQDTSVQTVSTQLFEMPFAIEASSLKLEKSLLIINNTEISIEQFVAQLAIKKSEFTISQPNAQQLTVILEETQSTEENSEVTEKNINNQTSLDKPFIQLSAVSLPIALSIEQLYVAEITVKTKGNPASGCKESCQKNIQQQWHSLNNHLSGSWLQTNVSIRQFQTSTSKFSIHEMVADAKLQPPYQIDTQFVSKLKDVPWWPEINESTQKISLQGSFDDLAIEMISEGKLKLTSQGKVNLVNADVPFTVSMTIAEIPMPLSFEQYGHPSSLSLALSGNLKEQNLSLTSQLNSYGYKKAEVKLIANHQDGNFNIDELVLDDNESASQLILNGEITLLPTEMTWSLSTKSTGFSLPKINLKGLSTLGENQEQINMIASNIPESITGRLQGNISSTGSWSKDAWSISISDADISGMINHSPLSITGDIGLNHAGHLQQGKLFIAFNNSELSLKTAGDNFWNIYGQLSVDSIDTWVQGVNGTLISDFSITGQQDNPIIQLNSEFTQLNWQHWYSTVLEVEANYQPMNGHQIQFNLNNKQLKMIKEDRVISIDDFVFDINGNANKHKIVTHWEGDFSGEFSIDGQLNGTFTHWQSTVNKSVLTYQNTVLNSDKAFAWAVDLTEYQNVIESHCWQSKGISICLPNKSVVGSFGNVALELDLDLSVIDELLLPKDIELNSQIKGDIKAVWSATQPVKAQANFSLSSGYLKVIDDFNEHQLSQWSQGEFAFTINEHQLSSTLWLTDTLNTTLVDINSSISFVDDNPIDIKIMLNKLNLQPFQSIMSGVVDLQGRLTADLAIDGTLQSPLISGAVRLEEGKLLLSQNANTLNKINSTLTIENNQATILGKFFLEDKEANLTGNMSWQDSLILNLDLKADTLPLIFPPQLVMSISPDLNFNLKDKTLTVSGNIDVLEGTYTIEKLPEDTVSLSDDVRIVDQYGKAVIKKSSTFDIKTDIRVNITKAFKISGQGLQSHLFGELQINQKEKQPFQLFGSIQSDNGTYQAYGQKLKIDKGEITFNGPADNPYLNLRASRHIKAEDIDVGIQITGLADTLDMQLFSTPTMEMPEMLSYLVRGRSLDSGTGNSTAAASLLIGFGVTNSVGLFDQLERIPLVSNIAVDTEGEGDHTQATVSGYLGNRVYLKYGIGVYEPINELTVRMYIFNRFWLEIVSGIEQSTDLYYSFDID